MKLRDLCGAFRVTRVWNAEGKRFFCLAGQRFLVRFAQASGDADAAVFIDADRARRPFYFAEAVDLSRGDIQ